VNKIVVVSGTSEFDTMLVTAARQQFRAFESRVSFTYLSGLPLESLLERVSKLTPDNAVLYTTLFRDGAGNPFIPHEVVEQVSARASVPVYGFLDQYLGRGIVGGSLYSFAAHGIDAAKMVLSLLSGSSAPALVEPPANKAMFDWRQMQRWHINEQLLPVGAEINFREPSAWQSYRWQILFVSAIMLAQ